MEHFQHQFTWTQNFWKTFWLIWIIFKGVEPINLILKLSEEAVDLVLETHLTFSPLEGKVVFHWSHLGLPFFIQLLPPWSLLYTQFQVDTKASGNPTCFQGTNLHLPTSWSFLHVSSHSVLILGFAIAAYLFCCRCSATAHQLTQVCHSVQIITIFACPELSFLYQKLFGDHDTSVCMSLSLILIQSVIFCVIHGMSEKAWWTAETISHSSKDLIQLSSPPSEKQWR